MSESKPATWAIRDIEHGKTFFFDSFDCMVKWIMRTSIKAV